jgi:glutamine amidotransferase
VLALLDYGSGNLRSVEKALRKVGADVRVITRPEGLKDARAAVLPGVGAFDDCITALQRQELLEGGKAFIASGRPFLGICVGYQALFEKSEEFNSCAVGLGLFAGKVVRFPNKPGLKVPQIGWNQLQIVRPDCPLYRGIAEGSYVYFVHSFYPQPNDDSIAATRTTYGVTFDSSIWRDNIYATQFHPEKSQGVGQRILRNFVELAGEG